MPGTRSIRRMRNFYPRPPRGGRRFLTCKVYNMHKFLSTPSARRATRPRWQPGGLRQISIHALREEGDRGPGTPHRPLGYFYPRPPRGGRPAFAPGNRHLVVISIHALREEGDHAGRECKKHLRAISIHALREEGDSQ